VETLKKKQKETNTKKKTDKRIQRGRRGSVTDGLGLGKAGERGVFGVDGKGGEVRDPILSGAKRF